MGQYKEEAIANARLAEIVCPDCEDRTRSAACPRCGEVTICRPCEARGRSAYCDYCDQRTQPEESIR